MNTRRPIRSVVVATTHPERGELLDALLVHAVDCDVIYVESPAKAYSRIRQVAPDLVIVHSNIDDGGACRLQSMLKFDEDLSEVPVVTCVIQGSDADLEDDVATSAQRSTLAALSAPMN